MKQEVKLIILSVVFILIILGIIFSVNSTIPSESTDNIVLNNNSIQFDSLTLKQKIAQMIIVYGNKNNLEYTNLNVGGIFLDGLDTKDEYKNRIERYQENSKIKLIVSTDMEGSWNPFSKFQDFPSLSEIKTSQEAYEVGLIEGELLKELGFNFNFAPVSEFQDLSYGDRTFFGSEEEIKEKLQSYILGLQQNVNGTCKHYPGKGMINNLHLSKDTQNITAEDLELFEVCFENNISAIMVGHQIVYGELDSLGKPSSISFEVINNLENFSGLIVSDEINMLGLSSFYFSKSERYVKLINSGENIILDFNVDLDSLLNDLETLTKEGKIDEEQINKSVRKILTAKGYILQ